MRMVEDGQFAAANHIFIDGEAEINYIFSWKVFFRLINVLPEFSWVAPTLNPV